MKVTFHHKSGRSQVMKREHAEILQQLGRGTYITRDMQAEPVVPSVPVEPVVPVVDEDLDSLSLQELHELAKERGVKVHHNAGAEKVRAALREAE